MMRASKRTRDAEGFFEGDVKVEQDDWEGDKLLVRKLRGTYGSDEEFYADKETVELVDDFLFCDGRGSIEVDLVDGFFSVDNQFVSFPRSLFASEGDGGQLEVEPYRVLALF
jgi:hypothetical protein